MKKHLIPFLAITLLSLPLVAEETLYLSLAGNDTWSGTLPEPNAAHNDGPLATLDQARLKVRERITRGLTKPVSVLIRGGEYELSKTIVFGPEDSGTESCPITYQAYPNEKPVFTGAKHLTDWRPCSHDPVGLPASAKGQLWSVEIPSALKGGWAIKTLYDGTTLLPRSSSGEFKLANIIMPEDYNKQPKSLRKKLQPEMKPVTFSRELHFQNNDLRNWKSPGDIEIFAKPKQKWLINLLPLEKVDTVTKTAWLAIDPTYQFSPENEYQVENAIEYLDKPGEWVFDRREGRIYLWPKKPLSQMDVRAPFLQEFIRVEGIEDQKVIQFLNFSGLSFRHGLRDTWQLSDKGLQHDWEMYDKGNALLRFRHAEDCSVRACDFNASSGGGVRLDLHCQRITVADNRFTYLGGTGILLSGYAPGTKDENRENIVSNNLIHHVGEIYWHSPGIYIAQSGHNLISHNTIHDLGYNGIVISGCRPDEFILHKPLAQRREWVSSLRLDECQPYIAKAMAAEDPWQFVFFESLLHARENRIEENEIYNVMLRLGDGNGIYFSAMGKNNRVERNYIHDIEHSHGLIRLDDNSAFTFIHENVLLRGNKMFEIKGPNEFRNNFIINGGNYSFFSNLGLFSDRNLFMESEGSNVKQRQYLLAKTNKTDEIYKYFDRCENNLLFVAPVPSNVKFGQDLVTAKQRGQAEVGLLFADPLLDLEAMKQKIFRFKPGSPAEKLGIHPLDMSQVGSNLKD